MWRAGEDQPVRIEVDDDFGEPGRFAVSELKRCWKAVLGCEPVESGGAVIRIRRGAADLTDEGCQLQTRDGQLVLMAGGALGAVFGAYSLLRIAAHCRFAGLGPEGERLPRRRAVTVDLATPRRFVPRLRRRALQFYFNDGLDLMLRRIDWMAKNGFNYLMYTPRGEGEVDLAARRVDPRTGDEIHLDGNRPSGFSKQWFDRYALPEVVRRGLKLDYNHHNLRSWLQPRKHFAAHPEWFAQIDGERSDEAPQMSICTSSAQAVAQVTDNVLAFAADNPQVKTIGVIPDDGFGMCQCAACVAMDDDPADAARQTRHHRDVAARNASKSRRYARLLNAVAAAVGEKHPDVRVGGAAYVDLQWPPPDPPLADNTMFWLAIFWRDGCRPLLPSSPDAPGAARLNDFFVDLIAQWRRDYRGSLVLYEYPMGMERHRSLPYPMLDVILAEWPHLCEMGVDGYTLQCWGANHHSYALNLLAYAAVAWDETADRKHIMRDYLLCTFGRAARTLRPIFEAMHDAVADLAASRPGDPAWEAATRCQRLRDAQTSDVDYLAPELNEGILQPNGESFWFLWQAIDRAEPLRLIDCARAQVRDPGETAAVEALAQVVGYWQMCAEHFDLKMNGKDVDGLIPQILEQIDRIPPGWVTPRSVRRWRAAKAAP